MAKKNKTEDDILVDVGEVYSKTERFVDQNRSSLTMAVGVLAALILGFVGYEFFIQGPAEAEAESAAWKAENYFEIDSINLAQLGDGYYGGLEEVMLDHEGTAAGQRAAYRMGIILRDAGDYEGAIEAFQKVDVNDNVIQVLATGNVGDCYVELTDYEAAAVAFDEAVDLASSSLAEDVLAPMFLYKGALVQIELGNYGAAKTMLDRIVNDYPKSQQNNASEALAASLSEG
jgi:tetratricopeptide (TPR) repeat protein